MIRQAMSSPCRVTAASISATALASAASTSAMWSSRGKTILGLEIRGQSNFGNMAVLRGSAVLVSERVYPERPWNDCRKWITLEPNSPLSPRDWLRRTFQSKAALRAFSTPRAPPSTTNMCRLWLGGTAMWAKVAMNSAKKQV